MNIMHTVYYIAYGIYNVLLLLLMQCCIFRHLCQTGEYYLFISCTILNF